MVRGKKDWERQGAKMVPVAVAQEMRSWQRWIAPGALCKVTSGRVLLRDPQNDWEGKQALRSDDEKWFSPGSAAADQVRARPGTVAVYLGELGRKTLQSARQGTPATRVAIHLFLLPEGPYIVHPEAFDPYSEEESAEDG